MSGGLRVIRAEELASRAPRALDAQTVAQARAILDDVALRGGAAVLEHAERLGDLRPGETALYGPEALGAALAGLPADQRALLERVGGRIRDFARAQRASIRDVAVDVPGGRAGHTLVPVASAGCYAPGGRFPLPSSVLMTAITAREAGVGRVWVASPRPTPVTLAAAAVAGAEGLLAIGGAQAIGALADGLCGVSACDVIVGPGNRWVTAAKQIVSDRVGIDMLAGPSELLVLADETADAGIVAADLLAQAEHDTDAVPMLVTTDAGLVGRVNAELSAQLETLPTRGTAERALENGFALVAADFEEAIAITDRIGPEHLEVMVRDARGVAGRVRNAGGVFIGAGSAEVFGDYGAGPNHVLPTGGTSRFRAGLSVQTFLRARTWLEIDPAASASRGLREDAAALARLESLEGHARSAERR